LVKAASAGWLNARRLRVRHEDQREASSRSSDDGELLTLILESATDFAIFTMDPNGITTSWNTGAERLIGYREDEIVGKSADVIFPPNEAGAAAEERRVALAHGRAEDERWQVRKDGTRLWASGLLMPLANGMPGFVKILRDRTAQHQAEVQLRASEELFRLLATNVPQLVFRSAPNGDRTWASPQWSIYSGLTFGASMGLGWLEAVHPDDRGATLAAWKDAPRTGEYYCQHRVRRSSDGEFRWHQTRAVPLRHDPRAEPLEWVGTMTDVHDLRMLQEQQKVLIAELQHRTRNLLAVVQSIARQTARSSASVEEFVGEYDKRLRALSRVQGLLAHAEQKPVELRDLIRNELRAHRPERDGAGKVTLEGPPALLPASSAQCLALAVHELATNAVKHGALGQPAGKLLVRWTIEGDIPMLRAKLEWQENEVAMPEGGRKRKGYGTELIERALPYQLGATTKMEFGPNGVRCEIVLPLVTEGVPDE
jgi:PAS domain S-box-containing protein